jgi:hypothetical protein
MRIEAGAPASYWFYSLMAFSHTRSRLLMGKDGACSWERWHNTSYSTPSKNALLTCAPGAANAMHLQLYNSPSQTQKARQLKARVCVFVGYSDISKAYVAIDLQTKNVLVTPNMIFDERFQWARDRPDAPPISYGPCS